MRIVAAGLVVSASALLTSAQEPTRITSASTVRLRATPADSAVVVATLLLGTDLFQLDTGGEGATWTRVRTTRGQDGWLSARLTRSLTAARLEVIEAIVRERLARQGDGFAPRTELVDFVERAQKDAQDPEVAGRFALYWVQATSSALDAVPVPRRTRGRQPPYRDWLAPRADTIVYNEPGGRWMIRPNHLWKLQDEHARSSSADELAWRAVQNGLPGECEGFIPCYLRRLNLLEGEYLRRSAMGKHVDEAVASAADASTLWSVPVVKPFFFDSAKDCAELVQSLDPFRAALAATRADGLQALLGRFDRLRGMCQK
ncbi:MAG: SH3 domain-containing protein [Acidobacteriota bacterium]